MLSISSRLHARTQALAYIHNQAVGVTNCHIKKGVTNCRIKKNGGTHRKSVEMPRIEPLSTLSGTYKLMYHRLERYSLV